MKRILLFLIALAPLVSFSQSSLTIFSEDGYPFFLILNGQRQNDIPQTNVRIDGLSQPYYATRIIFEDNTKPEISKNIPTVDPNTEAYADVTYKIKTTKRGDLKMRYFSATPVQPDYVAPPDMYVMHYGQPAPPPLSGGTTVTQTTVTTSGAPMGNGGASISVGAAGMNMNINISDPNMSSTVSQTTTTTTTTGFDNTDDAYDNQQYNNERRAPRGRDCRYPMSRNNYISAKETVAKASFDDTKLSTAKTVLTSNCMSTDQIIQLCKLFSFEKSKLEFAKYAYARTTDPGNYFKVANIFDYDSSRTELNDYISGY